MQDNGGLSEDITDRAAVAALTIRMTYAERKIERIWAYTDCYQTVAREHASSSSSVL